MGDSPKKIIAPYGFNLYIFSVICGYFLPHYLGVKTHHRLYKTPPTERISFSLCALQFSFLPALWMVKSELPPPKSPTSTSCSLPSSMVFFIGKSCGNGLQLEADVFKSGKLCCHNQPFAGQAHLFVDLLKKSPDALKPGLIPLL